MIIPRVGKCEGVRGEDGQVGQKGDKNNSEQGIENTKSQGEGCVA
jgi:hypothetical protein